MLKLFPLTWNHLSSLACRIFLTANRIHFAEKCSKASDPKVDLHFWDPSDAPTLGWRIVERRKPGPLFCTMR
jgi:hypothetical protein